MSFSSLKDQQPPLVQVWRELILSATFVCLAFKRAYTHFKELCKLFSALPSLNKQLSVIRIRSTQANQFLIRCRCGLSSDMLPWGGRKTFRLSNETEKGELWIARLTKFLSISRGPPSTTLTRGTAPGHARDTVLHSDVCCQADVGLIISPPLPSSHQGAEGPSVSAGEGLPEAFQGAVWERAEDRAGLQPLLHRSVVPGKQAPFCT